MKRLLSLLLCFSLPVYAQEDHSIAIANMAAQCRCVMDGGICQVSNNRNPPKPGTVTFTSAGPIDANVYLAFREKGPLMCSEGVDVCTSSWNGDACRGGFRLMFRQDPIVCLPAIKR